MTLRDLLEERRAAVCARWKGAILVEYGEVTAARWREERDRFANPVGHALAAGLPDILEAVTSDSEPSERAMCALEDIIRIRSVQTLTPSRSVAFVYLLRHAIRDELAAELKDGTHAAALAAIDARIEQLALLAFDLYVSLREQMFRLRQEELKRSVASILRRWHGGKLPEGAAEDVVRLAPPPGQCGRR